MAAIGASESSAEEAESASDVGRFDRHLRFLDVEGFSAALALVGLTGLRFRQKGEECVGSSVDQSSRG